MDIEWCKAQPLADWNSLREQFQLSNAKKAISPTQFNHQSTRGHCIMTLEIEMPMEDDKTRKQRGRVYVCDLAGTEPAGDIYCAEYKKEKFPDGSVEHILIGPHKDQRKTKELQDQGKKINLSLSEMGTFFMKMAEAVKKKTLKPGVAIPGCNTYFLCKYLKDTMLQARTYLFCAIRPEVKFHNYTFATLGFATNASVIKLNPKKATTSMSPGERKLMDQLEKMKSQLAEAQAAAGGGGGGNDVDIEALLAAKQAELASQLENDGGAKEAAAAALKQQQEDYGKQGISLTHFAKDTPSPYFTNLDEDPFRSNRFMYILDREETKFGPGGDIRPMALNVVKNHCTVENKLHPATSITPAFQGCTMVGGAGEVVHNGKKVKTGNRVALKSFDRVVMGGEILLYHKPDEDVLTDDPPTASSAIEEYQNCLADAEDEKAAAMRKQQEEFELMKTQWLADAEKGKLSDEERKKKEEEFAKEEVSWRDEFDEDN